MPATKHKKPLLKCRIKHLRNQVGMSLREVAGNVGISHVAVWQIERGENTTIATARKLADLFGETIDTVWPS